MVAMSAVMSVVQLTDRQKKICELIKGNSFISSRQMSIVLSVVKRTIERDLAAMQKKGILIRKVNPLSFPYRTS